MLGIIGGGVKWFLITMTFNGSVITMNAAEQRNYDGCMAAANVAAQAVVEVEGQTVAHSCMSQDDYKNLVKYHQPIILQSAKKNKP
jgi:hypothetical protein